MLSSSEEGTTLQLAGRTLRETTNSTPSESPNDRDARRPDFSQHIRSGHRDAYPPPKCASRREPDAQAKRTPPDRARPKLSRPRHL